MARLDGPVGVRLHILNRREMAVTQAKDAVEAIKNLLVVSHD